MMMTESKQL